MTLSESAMRTAAILLLAVPTIQWGGTYMLRVVRGRVPVTDFQLAFSRAGHAHAGVLVILALVVQLYADAAAMSGLPALVARTGVPIAAILMPAGFFLSVLSPEATAPNPLIALVGVGGVFLVAAVLTTGIGLLRAGRSH